jgi:hypothetical protein
MLKRRNIDIGQKKNILKTLFSYTYIWASANKIFTCPACTHQPRSQSYDRELQRQRCKKLTRPRVALCVLKTVVFSSTMKNALAYYDVGAVHSSKFKSRRIGSSFGTQCAYARIFYNENQAEPSDHVAKRTEDSFPPRFPLFLMRGIR